MISLPFAVPRSTSCTAGICSTGPAATSTSTAAAAATTTTHREPVQKQQTSLPGGTDSMSRPMAGQIQGPDGLGALQRSRGDPQGVGKAADTKDKGDESALAAGPAFTPQSSDPTPAALTTASRRLLLDGDQASTPPTDA